MHLCFSRISIFALMLFCIAASIFLIGTQSAFAQIDLRLKADGWKEFTFDDKKQNIFKWVGEDIVEIQTNSSVSIAYLPFDGKTLDLRKHLRWRLNGNMKVRLSTRMYRKKAGMIVSLLFIWPFPISQNMPALKKN